MPYFLRRTRDGAGDSGPLTLINRINPETKKYESEMGVRPRIGWAVQVGSIGGRTFVTQDYWQTTPVTEIIEDVISDDKNFCRFKTGNSEYEWGML